MTRHAGITLLTLVTQVVGILAYPGQAWAHEKWFYDATRHPTRWEQAFQFPGIVGVAVAVGLTVMAGLATMFGLFPRVIIATAWIFINMTLTVFNWVELLGHLPLYGVMAVLLIWTQTEEDQRLWVRGVLGYYQGVRPEQPSRRPI